MFLWYSGLNLRESCFSDFGFPQWVVSDVAFLHFLCSFSWFSVFKTLFYIWWSQVLFLFGLCGFNFGRCLIMSCFIWI